MWVWQNVNNLNKNFSKSINNKICSMDYLLKLEQERFAQSSSSADNKEACKNSTNKKKGKKFNKSNGIINKHQNRRSQLLKAINPRKSISSSNFHSHTKKLALFNGQYFRKGFFGKSYNS